MPSGSQPAFWIFAAPTLLVAAAWTLGVPSAAATAIGLVGGLSLSGSL
jgi:hypothetical protein